MVAPSKNFTVIADADIDPDSPVTTGLMTALRDNDIHLEEWLGLSATLKQADHAHAGFGVDGTKVISQVALVFDQTTNNSGSLTGAFTVMATITVASADLPSNRDAMIIATMALDLTTASAQAIIKLRVDGVDKQSLTIGVGALSGDEEGIALSEIVNLTSGSDRVIEVQGREVTGTITFSGLNLFSVLIT